MGPIVKFASLLTALACSGVLLATTKGPDAAGYQATDNTAYSFIDIANGGGGTGVLADTDDGAAFLTIPFSFQFYGQAYTSICASTNGLLTFVANAGACGTAVDFANTDLTVAGPPGDSPAILPFWTDLSFQVPGGGALYYQTIGTAGNRKFIVQWNNAYPLGSSSPVTFEVVLSEASSQILFQYRTVNLGPADLASNGGQATIGIRAASGNSNNQQIAWSYNAPALANGTAILFTPPPSSGVLHTISSNPPGLIVTIDNVASSTPKVVTWSAGSTHTLSVTTPQTVGGIRETSTGWSTGAGTPSITVTALAQSTTYTANFSTQYALTVQASSGGSVTVSPSSPDGYYNGGTTVQVTAVPASGSQFVNWTGDLAGSTNPQSLVMSAPRAMAANFRAASTPDRNTITVSSLFVPFMFERGGVAPATQTVSVQTERTSSITMSAPLSAWLKASLTRSTTPAGLVLSVNPTGLASGAYSDVVTLFSPGADDVTVRVNLTVQDPPQLRVSSAALTFAFRTGGVAPGNQSVSVTAIGRNLDVTATASTPWISVTPTALKTPSLIGVSVNPAGLAAGVYDESITLASLDATNSPLKIPVKLVVTADVATPPSPSFEASGVVNAASFRAGPLAPGSLFTILGTNLAAATMQASATPLPSNLGGSSVTINGVPAPLLYVSPTQINAQVPFEIPPGSFDVIVNAGGMQSAPVAMRIVPAAPGLFQAGEGRAAVLNADLTLNTAANPSPAAGIVAAYLTGQGQVDQPQLSGLPAPGDPLARTVLDVKASIGGQVAEVSFAGLAPGFVGLLQVNLKVPDLPPGDYPVVFTIADLASNSALISVR